MSGVAAKAGGCSGCGSKRLVAGAVGMTRAAMAAVSGRGRVPLPVFDARVAVCAGCPSRVARTNSCRECGCFIGPKALLASETCPRGAWPR